MALGIGRVLRGQKGMYRIIEELKASSVFKAQVLQGSSIGKSSAVLKSHSASEDDMISLKREFALYQQRPIASCPHIRTLHDLVGSFDSPRSILTEEDTPCLVLEWMENDLRSISRKKFREKPNILKLKSLDINPNNIFISDVDDSAPSVKVGDLGNVVLEGFDEYRVQSLATRAPEVWQGLGCWHSSNVWSLGVTLAHCLCPSTIFGARDKIVKDLTEAWCIAKIARLVGTIDSKSAKPEYHEDFLVAEALAFATFSHLDTGLETPFMNVASLREEIKRVPGPQVPSELLDFIESLLVIDCTKRPSAVEALNHPFLQGAPNY